MFWPLFFSGKSARLLTFFGLALPPVGDVWPVDWGDVRPKKREQKGGNGQEGKRRGRRPDNGNRKSRAT
jgi:hypothetical protein